MRAGPAAAAPSTWSSSVSINIPARAHPGRYVPYCSATSPSCKTHSKHMLLRSTNTRLLQILMQQPVRKQGLHLGGCHHP